MKKTFLNDKGYMVTEWQEKVEEVEVEVEDKAPSPAKPAAAKKLKVPSSGKKQASMMSFFGKK